MGFVKKRIIKYSIVTALGLFMMLAVIFSAILLFKYKLDFKVQLALLVVIAVFIVPGFCIPLVGADYLSVIVKYYVAKEKHIRLKNPAIYNCLKVAGIIIFIASIALMFIVGLLFDMIEIAPLICYLGCFIGMIVYFISCYLRELCFGPEGEQKMMKCPYCENEIPKRAHYCIYCDEHVTEPRVKKLKEIMDKLDNNNKTSFYK